MDCLTNYIGIKSCGLPDPKSGLWINDLPGMSNELLDNIANSEAVNFLGVFNKIQKRSILRFKTDVINIMAEKVTMKETVYQTRRLVKSTVNEIVIPKKAEWRGIYIMLPESKYSEFRHNETYMYSLQAGKSTLKVWDLNDGKELHSQEVDIVVGYNSFDVSKIFNLTYRVQEFFIGVDCTDFDTIQTLPDYYYWYNTDYSCAYDCNTGGYSRGYFQMYAGILPVGSEVIFKNIYKTGLGYGVAIGAEIGCSIDQFICDNKRSLQTALLYLYGAETLMEKIGSPRMNFFTASNLEATDELRSDFENRYIGNLKRSLKSIPFEGDNICFDCEEQSIVSYRGSNV